MIKLSLAVALLLFGTNALQSKEQARKALAQSDYQYLGDQNTYSVTTVTVSDVQLVTEFW